MIKNSTSVTLLRLIQVAVACIPLTIGLLALLNNTTNFSTTVDSVIKPLISMQGDTANAWRALPESLSPYLFIIMFLSESLVGFLALIGVFNMLTRLRDDARSFNRAKGFVYAACGWGIFVWGLCFFELGGDWFLAWENSKLADFQSGAVMYVQVLLAVFLYLKLCTE